MLKDYKTLEKAQHFIEDAGLPGAVNDFLAINGERLGIKNRVAFMIILHGCKFYSDVHGLLLSLSGSTLLDLTHMSVMTLTHRSK